MSQVKRIRIGFIRMAHFSVPGPATIVIVIPCHWMIVAILTAFITLLINLDEHLNIRIQFWKLYHSSVLCISQVNAV